VTVAEFFTAVVAATQLGRAEQNLLAFDTNHLCTSKSFSTKGMNTTLISTPLVAHLSLPLFMGAHFLGRAGGGRRGVARMPIQEAAQPLGLEHISDTSIP